MKSRKRFALSLVAAVVLMGTALVLTAARPSDPLVSGKIALQSIGALEFGPEGVLFAGDSSGGAIFAIDLGLGESPGGGWPEGTWRDWEAIAELDAKLAAMLGTTSRDVYIQDLAYHAPTETAYLSLMRGSGSAAAPVLVAISGDGTLAEVSLDDVRHAKLSIRDAPAPDALDHYGRNKRTTTITDLVFDDGELFISGLSNEEFASTLRRAHYPFEGDAKATAVEIYHGNHGAWETHAPIVTFIPFQIEGKSHLLASYVCTPLVTLPTADLKSGARVRGKTIAELGWGNVPIDMIGYDHGGEEFVLLANSQRGAMKFRAADIRAANRREGIASEVAGVSGVAFQTSPLGHVVQLVDMDAKRVLLLARDPQNGSLSLFARKKDLI